MRKIACEGCDTLAGSFQGVQRTFALDRVIAGNLDHDADLLEFLTAVASRSQVEAGMLSFLGAVQQARVAFYDGQSQKYETIALDEPLEIVHGTGNVSLLDGNIFVHAHVALSDRQGRTFGGHLLPGTIVFAGEYFLWALAGHPFVRSRDAVTGLNLWHR